MREASTHAATVVADGLAVVVGLASDPSLAVGGMTVFDSVAGALESEIRATDRASIAFPCVRVKGRKGALAIVLDDRAILAWATGIYRVEPHVDVVPRAKSWGATVAPGLGARQPVRILTVQWAERDPWVVAVPDHPEVAKFVRECFREAR